MENKEKEFHKKKHNLSLIEDKIGKINKSKQIFDNFNYTTKSDKKKYKINGDNDKQIKKSKQNIKHINDTTQSNILMNTGDKQLNLDIKKIVNKKPKTYTTNTNLEKTEDVYKLKISKNSIKSKNIESMYPNNIGIKETKISYLILYKNKKSANKDLKLNEKYKFYNYKLIFINFSYKENEESIRTFLKELGEILEITLEKNKDKIFTGKAIVTFEKSVKIDKELKLNNKIIYVERIRKQDVNDKRIFIGRIDMNLSILEIRKAVKSTGAKLIDIRIRFEKEIHKNIGYGHLSFKSRKDAIKFENNFLKLKEVLGPHSFYEYAKEKINPSRRR